MDSDISGLENKEGRSQETDKETPGCSGLSCLIVIPVKAVAQLVENAFETTLAIPRAAQETHTQVKGIATEINGSIKQGTHDLSMAAGSLMRGIEEVRDQTQEGLKATADGLKEAKKTAINVHESLQATGKTIEGVISTAQKVNSALAQVNSTLEGIAEAGPKIQKAAEATSRFFAAISPKDTTKPQEEITGNKDKTDQRLVMTTPGPEK